MEEALAWRGDLDAEQLQPEELGRDGQPLGGVVSALLSDRAEEIERSEGFARAKYFHDVAAGVATPITSFVEAWLAEAAHMKLRQHLDYRRAVKRFTAWLEDTDEHIPSLRTE